MSEHTECILCAALTVYVLLSIRNFLYICNIFLDIYLNI